MKIANRLYLSKNINLSEKKKILKKIHREKPVEDVFCICIDINSNYQLEIISSNEIFKKVYDIKNYIIIGLTKEKNEAYEIIRKIIEEAYNRYGNVNNLYYMFMEN